MHAPRRSLGENMPKGYLVSMHVLLDAAGCALTCDGAEACGAPGAAVPCSLCFAAASLCLAADSARYVL